MQQILLINELNAPEQQGVQYSVVHSRKTYYKHRHVTHLSVFQCHIVSYSKVRN